MTPLGTRIMLHEWVHQVACPCPCPSPTRIRSHALALALTLAQHASYTPLILTLILLLPLAPTLLHRSTPGSWILTVLATWSLCPAPHLTLGLDLPLGPVGHPAPLATRKQAQSALHKPGESLLSAMPSLHARRDSNAAVPA